jgi:CelD/BcsL family acetyltransferase involved in cellulose biosynthesis
LRIELHRSVPDELGLREAWNTLVDRMERPEVFYTYEWARAVVHAYADSLRPWLLLVHEGTELLGVAALAIDLTGRARFLCGTTADYCDLVSDPKDRSMLVEVALTGLCKAGIHDIVLANLPEDSETVASLPRLARTHGYHMGSRLAYACARVNLGSYEQRSKLAGDLKKKKSYRYNMNALARQGSVGLSHLTTWAEVEPVLPEFYLAHVARFLATHRISNLARTERRKFLTELGRLLSQSGWLAVSRMNVGERAIAWNYGFRFKGSWFYYQPTFESNLAQYSPGVCLLSGIIAQACESPELQIVDLGLGAEGYKERFADGVRKTLYVTLSSSPVQHLHEVTRYRVAELVKRSPRLESYLRNAIARFSAVRLARSKPENKPTPVGRSVLTVASAREQKVFYERVQEAAHVSVKHSGVLLVPIDLQILGKATIACEGDDRAEHYLLRAAQRLSSSKAEGYALIDINGNPIEFYWVAAFDGLYSEELQTMLSAPGSQAALIYDCFSMESAAPPAKPVHKGFAALADRVTEKGSVLWATVAAGDLYWDSVVQDAGFVLRYSLVSSRTLAGRRIRKITGSLSVHVDRR